MKCKGDTEWTYDLQSAFLEANTQTKKLTRYEPLFEILIHQTF